ncbi:MAG: TonB-dependent receptor [Xanthomonadales bacterium]|nr:TonB-dependent receptor [Xanthomonadales bacterium]
MPTNLKVQTAIHIALGVSVGALASSHVPIAFAQDAEDQEADESRLEEVIVTGSRIRRADLASASPVTVINREDLQITGLTDVGDFLQRMPSMSGSPIGTTTNNGGDGSVQIDLRGMGVDRTVTLVNGQRIVDGGDFQTIPSTMIERVEILKDGASAVYGADAVAGVVNIITRRDFEGVEFNAQVADWEDSAGRQDSFGVIAGMTFERGNFVFGAEYIDQEEAFQADVPWDFMQDSFYIYPEGCENQLTEPYPTGCYRLGSSSIPEGRFRLVDDGRLFLIGTPSSAPYQAGVPIVHDGRNYNYAPVNYLQTPYKRTNIFAEGHFDVTDNVRFNAEFRGNFRESAQELAPTPIFCDVGDPCFQATPTQLGVSADNFYLRQAIDNFNAANGTSLPYQAAVSVRRRMLEQPRRFTQEITQWQFVAGLEGVFNDVNWDVFVNRGLRTRSDQDFGQYLGDRFANALGPSADLDGDGLPECYRDINDPTTLIPGCVPLNMFGGGGVVRETGEPTATSVTQDMFDYISFMLNDSFSTKATLAGASLSGSFIDLPGGELGWAVGYGYWKQEFRFTPDSSKAADSVTGNASSPTEGDLVNNAVFLEVLAPVYDNGTQEIMLKGGVRYDDYDEFDGDTTWQLGVEFQVIDDLKLRGTAGTIFRSPTIEDLFAGTFDSFPTFTDPCDPTNPRGVAPGCEREAPAGENQALAKIGGNPFLEPETGDTYTAGIVWTPSFGDHDFTATVDYWKIELDDGISSLGVQFILEDCYIELNQASCDLITRRPADFGIQLILDGPLNVAEQGAEGVDTEVRWNYNSSIGQWQAALLWSHLIERTKIPFEGAEEQDLSGRFTDPTAEDGGAYAEDKANFSLQWAYGDLSIGYLAEYISGLDADTFCNCDSDGDPSNNLPDGSYIQDIGDELYHDLVASYTVGAMGLTISGGVTNFTDEEPPFIEVGFNATTDPSTYRLFGRGYFLRLAWKF